MRPATVSERSAALAALDLEAGAERLTVLGTVPQCHSLLRLIQERQDMIQKLADDLEALLAWCHYLEAEINSDEEYF